MTKMKGSRTLATRSREGRKPSLLDQERVEGTRYLIKIQGWGPSLADQDHGSRAFATRSRSRVEGPRYSIKIGAFATSNFRISGYLDFRIFLTLVPAMFRISGYPDFRIFLTLVLAMSTIPKMFAGRSLREIRKSRNPKIRICRN